MTHGMSDSPGHDLSDIGTDPLTSSGAIRAEHQTGARLTWKPGQPLEVIGLPVDDNTDVPAALVEFVRDVLGTDADIAGALDLARLNISYLRTTDGRRMVWLKVPVDTAKVRDPHTVRHVESWVAEVARRRPLKRRPRRDGTSTQLIVPLNDLQLGKGPERFGGLPSTLERLGWFLDEIIPEVFARARRNGRTIDRAVVALGGDLGENVCGSYPGQPWKVTLNAAEQFAAVLGVVDRTVDRLLRLSPGLPVDVTGVASNHDQLSRRGRDVITDEWDDRTFAVMHALAAGYGKADRYRTVRVVLPSDPLVAAWDAYGRTVALIHGHKAGGSGDAVVKMWRWWDGQIASRTGAAADADILLTAHYHHHFRIDQAGRTLIGLPSADGGSQYLTDAIGVWAPPGFVTLQVDGDGICDHRLWTSPADQARIAELSGRG